MFQKIIFSKRKDTEMQIKETDLSEVSDFVNHVLNATASDKSDTSVSIIKINFLAIVINFLESPKERKLQSKRYRYL